MKKELVDLQPKLEQAKIDNTKIMKVRKSNVYHTVPVFKANYHLFILYCQIYHLQCFCCSYCSFSGIFTLF